MGEPLLLDARHSFIDITALYALTRTHASVAERGAQGVSWAPPLVSRHSEWRPTPWPRRSCSSRPADSSRTPPGLAAHTPRRCRLRGRCAARVSCVGPTRRQTATQRKGGSVERHFDGERPPRPDVADLPPQGLLPGQPGRSPRASGERSVELELGGRIVPVLDVGSPVPRERRTHRGFHGMLNLVDDVIHDRVPIFECSYLV